MWNVACQNFKRMKNRENFDAEDLTIFTEFYNKTRVFLLFKIIFSILTSFLNIDRIFNDS